MLYTESITVLKNNALRLNVFFGTDFLYIAALTPTQLIKNQAYILTDRHLEI